VSPLWADELRIGLAPERIVYRRKPRWRRKAAQQGALPLAAKEGEEPWTAGIAALRELIGPASRRLNVSIILSNRLVRYQLLPWNAELESEAEWLAFAKHAFTSAYGPAAKDWEIRVCATADKGPRLASAVDGALLPAIQSACQAPGVQLVSVQPCLMSAFNRSRKRMFRSSAWFVIEEPENFVLALIENGKWRLVRSRRNAMNTDDAFASILDREAVLAGIEHPCERVVFHSEIGDRKPGALKGYRIEDVTPELRALAMAS